MKRNIIKKGLFLAVSLSFIAALSACSTESSTNIFADKEILAYAKKNGNKGEYINKVTTKALDYDTLIGSNNLTFVVGNKYYVVFKDNTSGNYYYITTMDEKVINLGSNIDSITNQNADYLGACVVYYDDNTVSVYLHNGEPLIDKLQYTNFEMTHRLISEITEPSGENRESKLVIKLSLKEDDVRYYYVNFTYQLTKYKIVINETKEVESMFLPADEKEYSYTNNLVRTKDYNVYKVAEDALLVLDKDNKFVNEILLPANANSRLTIQGDHILVQNVITATKEDYDYETTGPAYYKLDTTSINLKTGEQKILKDYKYILGTQTNIYGYNEALNRNYVAYIYANVTEISNKTPRLNSKYVILNAEGKIVSSKPNNVGSSVKYINDNLYEVQGNNYKYYIDGKGKNVGNKGEFYVLDSDTFYCVKNGQALIVDANQKAKEDSYFYYSGILTGTTLVNGAIIAKTQDGYHQFISSSPNKTITKSGLYFEYVYVQSGYVNNEGLFLFGRGTTNFWEYGFMDATVDYSTYTYQINLYNCNSEKVYTKDGIITITYNSNYMQLYDGETYYHVALCLA